MPALPDSQWLLALATLAVMLVGAVGVVLPVLPDVWLIWLAALAYGLLAGFDGWVGGTAMLLLTGLTVLGIAIDLALGPVAARRGGASWQAIGASLGLGLLGLLVLPPFGLLIGAVVGLFLVEYHQRGQNTAEAITAVRSYLVGCGWSVALRLGIAFLMIGIWGLWVIIAAT
jgi:uncharacterized protein YqgC (DUF456 family)